MICGRVRFSAAVASAIVTASAVASAATGCAPASATPPQPQPALRPIVSPISFGDTFDNGRRDGWTVANAGPARWRVIGGSLRETKTVPLGSQIVAGNPAWGDYDVAVTVRPTDKNVAGVVFRFVDRFNFYRFSVDRKRGTQQLVARIRGRDHVLARSQRTYKKNQRYRLRIHAVGPDLRALVDGRQMLAARNGSLPHGRFGLYSQGTPARFDSVSASIGSTDYFTVAVLPDTQFESESAPKMFQAQTSWLARNRAAQNIVAVLHEGDVVNRLERAKQWRNARTALNYVAGKIPLTVAAGNHDVQLQHRPNPRTTYGKPFEKMIKSLPNYRVAGQYGSLRNTYQLLDAGGVRFVIVNLTYGPSNKQLAWAGQVADRYRDRQVILLTHDYLGQNNQVRGLVGDRNLPSASGPDHNDGTGIWQKFVRSHANVRFTFNGHVITPTLAQGTYSAGRLVSLDDAGQAVYQVLANFQIAGHGGGFLRLVRFYPAEHRVQFETYSPYLRRSLTDPDNRFEFTDVALR